MTLRTSQRNAQDLAYEVARAYPGGIEALAFVMGMNFKLLYKKLSPANPEHELTVSQFSEVMERCSGAGVKNAYAPLEALNWRHGGVFVTVEDLDATDDDSILKAAAQAMERVGSVAGSINDALEGGEITDKEMEVIEPRFRKAFTAMASWFKRVKSRKEKDSSKPRRGLFRREAKETELA